MSVQCYLRDIHSSLGLAHTAQILSLATEILSSVVSDEKEFLAYLILKVVVSDKNLLYTCFPHTASLRRQRQKSWSSATKIVLCALGFTSLPYYLIISPGVPRPLRLRASNRAQLGS